MNCAHNVQNICFDDWKIIHKTPHGLLSYICIVHNSKFLNLQSYKYSSIGHPFQTQLGAIGPTLRLVFLAERSNLQKPLNIELVKGKKTQGMTDTLFFISADTDKAG